MMIYVVMVATPGFPEAHSAWTSQALANTAINKLRMGDDADHFIYTQEAELMA